MTIVDIALHAYTHVAAEGGFDLSAVTAGLARVAIEPGHVAMNPAPVEGAPKPAPFCHFTYETRADETWIATRQAIASRSAGSNATVR